MSHTRSALRHIYKRLKFQAGAIAAGNACVVKMSELTPSVSGLVAELLPQYMDPDRFAIVNGAIPETTKLLELQWDHSEIPLRCYKPHC